MEYLVVTPSGHDYARDASWPACVSAARRLGTGARIERLDDALCKTGEVLFEVDRMGEQD